MNSRDTFICNGILAGVAIVAFAALSGCGGSDDLKDGERPCEPGNPDRGCPSGWYCLPVDGGPQHACYSSAPDGSVLCGNSQLDPGEQCDTANLNGQTCESQGYPPGHLSCNDNCTFNFFDCVCTERCGNDVAECTEDCDGSDLGGATCRSLGYVGGVLDCTAGCLFDVSGCTS